MKRGVNLVAIKSASHKYETADDKRAKIINDIYYKDDALINDIWRMLENDDLKNSKILPTPFAVNNEHGKREHAFAVGNITYSQTKSTSNRRYSQVVNDLNIIMYNCDKIVAHKLLQYIQANLIQDSNKIVFKINEVAKIIRADRGNVADAVKTLKSLDIIAETDCQNVYIINHNYLFNGDIVAFEQTYNKNEYDNRLININGKICINSKTIKKLQKINKMM